LRRSVKNGSEPTRIAPTRKVGVPNKASAARADRAVAEGRKLPPDELLRNAENCRAMAVRYAPMQTNPDTGAEPNPKHNEERYSHWLAQERDALKAAAPYYGTAADRDCAADLATRQGQGANGLV
jgi:hypothetical protein